MKKNGSKGGLPNVGDRIDAYNDGKASPSRLRVVVVDATGSRAGLGEKGWRMWRKALREDIDNVFKGTAYTKEAGYVETRSQFWDWNCDQFIVGHFLDGWEGEKKEQILFARRFGYGWYGVNWNYLLDVFGEMRAENLKTWRECAQEMGMRMRWNKKTGRYDYIDLKTGKITEY